MFFRNGQIVQENAKIFIVLHKNNPLDKISVPAILHHMCPAYRKVYSNLPTLTLERASLWNSEKTIVNFSSKSKEMKPNEILFWT